MGSAYGHDYNNGLTMIVSWSVRMDTMGYTDHDLGSHLAVHRDGHVVHVQGATLTWGGGVQYGRGVYMSRMQHWVTRVKIMGYIEPDPGCPIWLSIVLGNFRVPCFQGSL